MKIKSIILIFVMMLLIFPIDAYATEHIESDYSVNASKFVSDIGVELDLSDFSRTVTRGEFIDIVTDVMKYAPVESGDGTFTDVANSHPHYTAIYTAKSIGIISGAASSRFKPNDAITFNAAIKIMANALGYFNIAEARGGYPTGYVNVAKDIGLTDNVAIGGENALIYSEVINLVYNFMVVDVCEITEITNGDFTWQRIYGKNILYTVYSLTKVEGVVKSAGYTSMVPDFNTNEKVIEINGKTYKTTVKNCEYLLGMRVSAYYNDASSIISAVYVLPENKVYTVDASELTDYENFCIYAYDEASGKDLKFKLNKGFDFVKNGRASHDDIPNFLIQNGKLTLIDNDNDSFFDVVIAKETEYMVVGSVSALTSTAFDTRNGSSVYFGDDENMDYSIVLKSSDGNTSEVKFESLSADMVLSFSISDDGCYTECEASAVTVKGTISEVGSDYAVINGKKYKTNTYFDKYADLRPGIGGEFLLAYDGTLTYVKNLSSGNMRYAYLIDCYIKSQGISKDAGIKLLDQNGSFVTYGIADKLMLNGKSVSREDASVQSALFPDGRVYHQVIRYGVNYDGFVTSIDTPSVPDSNASLADKYISQLPGNDSLKLFGKSVSVFYHSDYQTLTPYISSCAESIIFKVPKDYMSGTSDIKYEDKYFSVIGYTGIPKNGSFTIDIYDQNEQLKPKAIVMYVDASANSSSVTRDQRPQLVDSVTDAIDENGYKTKKITILSGSRYITYYASQSLLEELADVVSSDGTVTEIRMPKGGDIIRTTTNSLGELTALSVDSRYVGKRDMEIFSQSDDQSSNGYQFNFPYFTGLVFSTSANSLVIKAIEAPEFHSYYGDNMQDSLMPFTATQTQYMRYNITTGKAQIIKRTDLQSLLAVGEENASFITVYANRGGALTVVEYVE